MKRNERRLLEQHKSFLHALRRRFAYEDKLAEHDALDNFGIKIRWDHGKWGVWLIRLR